MPRIAWLPTDPMTRYQMLTPSSLLAFSPVVNHCNFRNISKSLSNKHKRGLGSLWLPLPLPNLSANYCRIAVFCALGSEIEVVLQFPFNKQRNNKIFWLLIPQYVFHPFTPTLESFQHVNHHLSLFPPPYLFIQQHSSM